MKGSPSESAIATNDREKELEKVEGSSSENEGESGTLMGQARALAHGAHLA